MGLTSVICSNSSISMAWNGLKVAQISSVYGPVVLEANGETCDSLWVHLTFASDSLSERNALQRR